MSIDIATENARTDGRIVWEDLKVSGHGDITVAGFARSISKNIGETIQFSVDGIATVIDIYRVGWYGGDGFRKVATITNTPTTQPQATTIPNSNGATTCTGWSVTASWAIPSDAVSGMYLALVRSVPGPDAFYISFVVRDDSATADIVYKTSDSTWGAAYNHYGTKSNINGKNVYGSGTGVGNIMERSFAVDYHRPVITRGGVSQTFWMACEMPMIRFLERQGYAIKYVTCVDLDKQGKSLLTGAQVFLSSGHDEYWSEPMRRAVEQYRDEDAGRSIFMSGNEVFWKHRYVYSGDRATLYCYKDTMPGPSGFTRSSGAPLDPVSWTGTWKDTRWPNREPEWLLTGTDFRMNGSGAPGNPGMNDLDMTIPMNPYGGHKVWGGSALVDGDITLTRALGFEADEARPTQPSESVRMLAAYTRDISGARADDNGENYTETGMLEWGIVSQRYTGGGLTIGFGTCQWSWVLDGTHDRGPGTDVSLAAQQMTVTMLRDLGAEPETLMSGITLQPVNNLDEYGEVPVLEFPGGTWYNFSGNTIRPYAKKGANLVPLVTELP